MEDDAHCATGTRKQILRVLPKLPSDWDLFFIGGKPFSYHTEDPSTPRFHPKGTFNKT